MDFEIPTDLDELMANGGRDEGTYKVKRLFKTSEIAQCLDGELRTP